jgi:hypothetical protein
MLFLFQFVLGAHTRSCTHVSQEHVHVLENAHTFLGTCLRGLLSGSSGFVEPVTSGTTRNHLVYMSIYILSIYTDIYTRNICRYIYKYIYRIYLVYISIYILGIYVNIYTSIYTGIYN